MAQRHEPGGWDVDKLKNRLWKSDGPLLRAYEYRNDYDSVHLLAGEVEWKNVPKKGRSADTAVPAVPQGLTPWHM